MRTSRFAAARIALFSMLVSVSFSAFAAGCNSSNEAAATSPSTSGANAKPVAGGEVGCTLVVEKIASIQTNPADASDPSARKLWTSMCEAMNPAQRTCVLAAKKLDDMKECVKDVKMQ